MEKLPESAAKLVENSNIIKEFKALMKIYSSNHHTWFYQCQGSENICLIQMFQKIKQEKKVPTCLYGPGK